MSRVSLGARWSYYGEDWQAKRDQLLAFVDALRLIHPLLECFSEQGKKYGWGPMLKRPELHEMTDTQWEKLLRIDDGSFKNFTLWNRRSEKGKWLYLHPCYTVPGPPLPFEGSHFSTSDLPDTLVTEPILTSMLEAMIAAFRPDHAQIATFFPVEPCLDQAAIGETELAIIRQRASDIRRSDRAEWWERAKQYIGGTDTPVWRLWLVLGQPWPKPGSAWMQLWQSEPPDEEKPWLGGTLYTWHKYAPWNLPDESDWNRQAGWSKPP